MRIITLALASMLATSGFARAVDRHHRIRVIVTAPMAAADPAWPVDYNIVPRYRYRPQDDRIDTSPNAKPVAPSNGDFGGTGGSGW
jgi:hypothetical protein